MNQVPTSILPPQSSTIASEVDALFYFILISAAIIFAIVLAGIIFFSIRFRRRRGTPDLTTGPTHNTRLEILWSVIPTLLVIIVFFLGFRTYMKMSVVPKDALEVKVTARKWMWIFEYPNGYTSINDLTVPVDKPIKMLMSSEDVIHSFFVPAFRIKMDVLPSRYTVTWFEATATGQFDLLCAEYCGTGHSEMLGRVTVVEEADFAAWLAEEGDKLSEELPLDELGRTLFTSKACITCHSIDGSPHIGPTAKGLYGHEVRLADGTTIVADENYLRESILDPTARVVDGFQPVMPTYQGLVTNREVDALVNYIKSLAN